MPKQLVKMKEKRYCGNIQNEVVRLLSKAYTIALKAEKPNRFSINDFDYALE